MNDRTCSYLAGRFGDHYRRTDIPQPPAAHRREWGYILWEPGSGTTMVRHRSLAEIGQLQAFLAREKPRHVYYSAGYYHEPGASSMDGKQWNGADLIFDLDADHLPAVNPETDDYATMLAACKKELVRLLDLLMEDLGFDEVDIVFSGGRGYHVHVRSKSVQSLDRRARRDIVEYIRGEGLSVESVLTIRHVQGVGRTTPAQRRHLDTTGGWSKRVHTEVLNFAEEITDLSEEDALETLQNIEGIGPRKAESIYSAVCDRFDQLADGNVDVHPAFVSVLEPLLDRTIRKYSAAIDEPVTTDVNRLIRLPGSLHGGSGLRVTPIPRDQLEAFDPLTDTIPSSFRDHQIAIELPEPVETSIGGEQRRIDEGRHRVPEYVAIHLMARGEAAKIPESAI